MVTIDERQLRESLKLIGWAAVLQVVFFLLFLLLASSVSQFSNILMVIALIGSGIAMAIGMLRAAKSTDCLEVSEGFQKMGKAIIYVLCFVPVALVIGILLPGALGFICMVAIVCAIAYIPYAIYSNAAQIERYSTLEGMRLVANGYLIILVAIVLLLIDSIALSLLFKPWHHNTGLLLVFYIVEIIAYLGALVGVILGIIGWFSASGQAKNVAVYDLDSKQFLRSGEEPSPESPSDEEPSQNTAE